MLLVQKLLKLYLNVLYLDQDGVKETGVSLAYTVRALDAGPIIAKEKKEIDEYIKVPNILHLFFFGIFYSVQHKKFCFSFSSVHIIFVSNLRLIV